MPDNRDNIITQYDYTTPYIRIGDRIQFINSSEIRSISTYYRAMESYTSSITFSPQSLPTLSIQDYVSQPTTFSMEYETQWIPSKVFSIKPKNINKRID